MGTSEITELRLQLEEQDSIVVCLSHSSLLSVGELPVDFIKRGSVCSDQVCFRILWVFVPSGGQSNQLRDVHPVLFRAALLMC